MIPRYQRLLLYCLLVGIVTMALFLFYERQRVRDRMTAKMDGTPLLAPSSATRTATTLELASDRDGSIVAVQRQMALPETQSLRARALIDRLMAEYALPTSEHRVPDGVAVDDVFLVDTSVLDQTPASSGSGQLAVINLRGSFVDRHPSGVQTEMLSVLSILGTLHANFPEITEVRFFVDGRPRETLAGHVDLQQVYPALDTTIAAYDLRPAP